MVNCNSQQSPFLEINTSGKNRLTITELETGKFVNIAPFLEVGDNGKYPFRGSYYGRVSDVFNHTDNPEYYIDLLQGRHYQIDTSSGQSSSSLSVALSCQA